MISFDFKAFQSEFGLTNDFAAKVFAVSRRTVVRWRAQGLIPRSAWHLALTIQRNAPPWTSGFARAHAVGICQLALPWREDLFAPPGGQWQDYRTPQQRRDLARWREQAPARAEARAEAEKAQRVRARMLAGRKIAEAHRRRREAALQAAAARPPMLPAGPASAIPADRERRPLPAPPPARPRHPNAHEAVQSSTWRPGTRANSRTLAVTTVSP